MSKITLSLNIDDGAPVNLYYFHDLQNPHTLIIPPALTKKFGKLCEKYDVKSKFSIVPMAAGLGRLDTRLNLVDQRIRKEYIRQSLNYIRPRFSITPELLTHYLAWNLKSNQAGHFSEYTFMRDKSAEEIAEYVSLALTILDNVGLTPSGVTSPWATGFENEQNYAAGIGMAFKRVLKKNRSFYFLHHKEMPEVMCDTPESGRVLHIPANSHDKFWCGNNRLSAAKTRKQIIQGIDEILSEDGRKGELRDFAERGLHYTILTHWSSLYSEGQEYGLEGLQYLLERIRKVFGDQVEWKRFEDLDVK